MIGYSVMLYKQVTVLKKKSQVRMEIGSSCAVAFKNYTAQYHPEKKKKRSLYKLINLLLQWNLLRIHTVFIESLEDSGTLIFILPKVSRFIASYARKQAAAIIH